MKLSDRKILLQAGLETSKAPTDIQSDYRANYHCCKNIVMPFSLVLEIRSIHQALYSYINRRDFRFENMKGSSLGTRSF